ncbi:alpha-keto acid decarboxylase family protein [uncultured Clostridium sp.]|uniref:alpha-keto acid decarboxylase family protein n=1 Tax=uncultured Clostridium sp. TaxID=59620 RepID=UPI00261B86DD|nr:alpha-keto acid decarboxylase family protein [uncultured Clostridium sp.]
MKVTIGDYLLNRLKEFNVKHVYGVPGDYNLLFLDHVEDMTGIDWVGNCNELNASYAADGYARVNGMSALVTTFGVGELSAINGVAGAYAEDVPIVKITGIPSMTIMNNSSRYVHHSLGDGQYYKFYNMYREVTASQTILSEMNAAREIDRVLTECYITKKPVYIGLPFDIVDKEIEVSGEPLDIEVKTNEETLKEFIKDVKELVSTSKGEMVLADYEVDRCKLSAEARNFVKVTGLPVSTTSMGKTAVNEYCDNFVGIYNGVLSPDSVKEAMNKADVAFFFGVKLSDFTTACFNLVHDDITVVEIHPLHSKIGEKMYCNISMKDVLSALLSNGINYKHNIQVEPKNAIKFTAEKNKELTQQRFYNCIESVLNKGDILLAETGTAFSGATGIRMPENSKFIGQPLWASIGYTLPALLGSQMADRSRRNMLIIGDGSFQLTCQEISTMIREDVHPIIFVINNDGYTIEKLIHGPERKYNSINMWDYKNLVNIFDLNQGKSMACKVKTEEELTTALELADKNKDKLIFIELVMDSKDAPNSLISLGDLLSEVNGY